VAEARGPFQAVVVGYDGSDQAKDAFSLGRVLAEPSGGRLILAWVVPG
jgi:nucleotide-binding universal stress UspA family protein